MYTSEFEKFVTDIRPKLTSVAVSVVHDREAAEDIVQDCLLKMWSLRATLDEYNSPEALALTIVRRLSINVMRSRKESVEINDNHLDESESSPEQELIKIETGKAVNKVLAKLPDAQQVLITMRHVDGLSNAEIAAVIGSTEGAVRTALSRARRAVADLFIKHQLSNI